MLNQQVIQQSAFSNLKVAVPQGTNQVMAGGAIALISTFGPFVLSFQIANSIGLNSVQCHGASIPASMAALVIVVLAVVLAPRIGSWSAMRIASATATIFTVLGVLASLTM